MADNILTQKGFAYGQLNAVERKKDKLIYNNLIDPIDVLRGNVRSAFSAESVKGVTQFKAIVLRIEEDDSTPSFWDNLTNFFDSKPSDSKIVKFKGMIPEIHGSILPSPTTLGNENSVGADDAAIDKFPTFAAKTTNMQVPKVGDIVWVTFENVDNLEGGIYAGPTDTVLPPNPGAASSKGAAGFHPCGKLLASGGKGGSLSTDVARIVANFPDFKNHRTPVDPMRDRGELPLGKGLFTNMYANLKNFPVAKAVDMGLDWIATLGMWQGSDKKGTKTAPFEKVKEMVDAYHNAGIRVYLWGFPRLDKIDEWVNYMFGTANDAGCIGVISDPEAGMINYGSIGSWSIQKKRQKTREFTDKCNEYANMTKLCYGVTSYEIPGYQAAKNFAFAELAPADFAIPQSYRAYPQYGLKRMVKGLKQYHDVGFKNILAMSGLYGKEWKAAYPQYNSNKKPPEEVIRRTGWLLGDAAQKYISYPDAFMYWKWVNLTVKQPATWPQNLMVTFTNITEYLKTSPEVATSTKGALKKVSDASTKEKTVKNDKVTSDLKKSESGGTGEDADASNWVLADPPKTAKEKSAEADVAKDPNAKPKLTIVQQTMLDSANKLVATKKAEVEELDGQIEGLESTSLKGSPSQKAAAELRPKLKDAQKELIKAEKVLRTLQKEYGIRINTAGAKPPATSATPSQYSGKCARNSGGGSSRSALLSTSGIGDLPPYQYDNTEVSITAATPWIHDNRVRYGNYPIGSLDPSLIVDCYNRKVHKLAAKRIIMLNEAWVRETGRKPFTSLSCGLTGPPEKRWKKLKWSFGDKFPRVLKAKKGGEQRLRVLWDQMLIDEYGSVPNGMKWMAWNGPHETTLAFDFYYFDAATKVWIRAISKTNKEQKQTQFYKWVKENAHRFGIAPYRKEAWHWEVQLTRKAWYTGEDFVTDGNYAVTVRERSTKTGLLTSDKAWRKRLFE